MALRLFAESHFCELGVADHKVAGDEGHFDGVFPFAVELLAAAFVILAAAVITLRQWALTQSRALNSSGS